jgi:hypothetical protein
MRALTAIDILLEPDEAMRERAIAMNAALRRSVPSGFSFDESHAPHVTIVQRYVRSDALERVFTKVGDVVPAEDLGALRLRAVGLVAGEFGTPPRTVLASVVIEPAAALLRLHRALVQAMGPLAEPGGTAAAFFTDADEPGVNDATITYVEEFVPLHSGEHYEPHLSVGLGERDFVAGLVPSPFEVVDFSPIAIGVYRLGDLGTARQVLRRWQL